MSAPISEQSPAITPPSNQEMIDKLYGLSSIVELAIYAIDAENGVHSARYALTLLDSKLCDLSNLYEELECINDTSQEYQQFLKFKAQAKKAKKGGAE